MPCLNPHVAYWFRPEFVKYKGWHGIDRPIFLGDFQGWKYDYSSCVHLPPWVKSLMCVYLLPCGKCLSCRKANALQWAFRAQSELSCHTSNAFLTLTVDDVHMDEVFPNRCLQHRPWQLFAKRLRKYVGSPIRFLMCGEYGTNSLRPHYHAIVFGWFPSDVAIWSYSNYLTYISKKLGDLWPFGFHTVSEANLQTIKYLVGYVLKKVDCKYPSEAPPYLRASSRPAIGKSFYEQFSSEIFAHNDLNFSNAFVYLDRFKIAIPRYYVKLYDKNADNVDSVLFHKSRQSALFSSPILDKCDLQREEDFMELLNKVSHNKRFNEV